MLVKHSLNNDNASHILLIPPIVAWLWYGDRAKIAKTFTHDFTAAAPLVLLAAVAGAISAWGLQSEAGAILTFFALSFILLLVAGFVAIFGQSSARAVWFSLAFLGFAIPLPGGILDRSIYLLQYGSAAVAESIFNLSGVPVLREGFVFHLPALSIEVARECSGIRSSIALIILAILVAHFSFSRFWKKAVFVCAGLLMMVIKNGVRIATLTILAKDVDPSFLYGRLHHDGGVVFFLMGLALLVPVYWFLRRREPTVARPLRASSSCNEITDGTPC